MNVNFRITAISFAAAGKCVQELNGDCDVVVCSCGDGLADELGEEPVVLGPISKTT